MHKIARTGRVLTSHLEYGFVNIYSGAFLYLHDSLSNRRFCLKLATSICQNYISPNIEGKGERNCKVLLTMDSKLVNQGEITYLDFCVWIQHQLIMFLP